MITIFIGRNFKTIVVDVKVSWNSLSTSNDELCRSLDYEVKFYDSIISVLGWFTGNNLSELTELVFVFLVRVHRLRSLDIQETKVHNCLSTFNASEDWRMFGIIVFMNDECKQLARNIFIARFVFQLNAEDFLLRNVDGGWVVI